MSVHVDCDLLQVLAKGNPLPLLIGYQKGVVLPGCWGLKTILVKPFSTNSFTAMRWDRGSFMAQWKLWPYDYAENSFVWTRTILEASVHGSCLMTQSSHHPAIPGKFQLCRKLQEVYSIVTGLQLSSQLSSYVVFTLVIRSRISITPMVRPDETSPRAVLPPSITK